MSRSPNAKKSTRRAKSAQADSSFTVEELVEAVLSGSDFAGSLGDHVEGVRRFNSRSMRVVVLGGGTGMSAIVGGHAQTSEWSHDPLVGLKMQFKTLDVVACTTDDGGSTGELLKQLPMIGIGDLRKSCLSMILPENLQRRYGITEDESLRLVSVVQQVMTYRFPTRRCNSLVLRDPLLAVPARVRKQCPSALADGLRQLGSFLSARGKGPTIAPAGHSLGNLLLTAAILQAAGSKTSAPSMKYVRQGLDFVSSLIGGRPGHLHAVTATPGELTFQYANGVAVRGQSKAGKARRGSPVKRVLTDYAGPVKVNTAVTAALKKADLVIYAPGSVYSSMMPILQLEPIIEAIRANRKALKVLGANFWIQEGETDISPGDVGRGFLVSDLFTAYDQNIPGGMAGLFDVALGANLERIPGHIIRNYALEGKRPIHLDRAQVEGMGIRPIEATLVSLDHLKRDQVIHHDTERFALAIRTLLYARTLRGSAARRFGLKTKRPRSASARSGNETPSVSHDMVLLCEYEAAISRVLGKKVFRPARLRGMLQDLAWENRDIRPAHLKYFDGVQIVRADRWGRSTEWDNVLGYYDPEDKMLKLHEQLLENPVRLKCDMLVALGESLLGRYVKSRRWVEDQEGGSFGSHRYEIVLQPERRRGSYLGDEQLRKYLRLARMVPDPIDSDRFRITLNNGEGFLSSGLLFGLLFAWYLDNRYGGVMEYEMSLLRWPADALLPSEAQERARKQGLVDFFRNEVFGRAATERES